MITTSKRDNLNDFSELSQHQQENSKKNKSEYLQNKVILDSLPRRLILELTNACNLSCKMCGRNAAHFKPNYMNPEVIGYFRQYLNIIEEITLMGWGEPTLHPEFKEIVSTLSECECRKYMCTNGMKLKEYAELLVTSNFDLLSVSIDGAKAKTNDTIRRGSSLKTVLEGIDKINKFKYAQSDLTYPYLSFVFCAMRSNIEELPALIKLAHDYRIERVKVVHLTAFSAQTEKEILWNEQQYICEIFNKASESAEEYSIELELPPIQGSDPAGDLPHSTCYSPWRDMFISSDLAFRPCMSTNQTLGTLNMNKTLEEQWNNNHYQDMRQRVNADNMPLQCRRCYQATFANWNKYKSYYQTGEEFSHEWK